MVDLWRQLRQPAVQSAHADHPRECQRLVPQWTFQTDTLGNFETTTLVRDNVLYVTGPQNVAWAIDARTGRQIWRYRRELPPALTACCGLVNRGFGVLGDRLFMTTLDAHLLALDMKTGAIVWDATLEDYKRLRLDDRAARRQGQGDRRRGGRRVRYPRLHRRVRRADAASARGASTRSPDRASRATTPGRAIRGRRGGAGVWATGAYDPELNLIYLRNRQSGPRLPQRESRGRQSLQHVAGRARRRHREAPVALPVHAARRARLGLDGGPGPGRHHDRRTAAQGRDAREPQRFLLHARSHHRQGDRREAVRGDELGQGSRTAIGRPMLLPGHSPMKRAR